MTSNEIIKEYKLKKHPEGGWYKEIIRSGNIISLKDKKRNAVTSIYFLLTEGDVSKWHAVDADEIWIFLDGKGLELHRADLKNNKYIVSKLGRKNRQILVPAGVWQAARPEGKFAFVACVVAPGFEFEGFKLLNRKSPDMKRIFGLDEMAKEFIP